LDPVYTARALAGLIDLVRRGVYGSDETIVFWHTGGVAGLFPRAGELLH
jgi:1-aminocyclopropane-1-carboxylate deaminase/D-cysteine desulfhydrase-like pyridoxal-dependent ACC family enzyme